MRKHFARLSVWSLPALCAAALVSGFAVASPDEAKTLAALDDSWSKAAGTKNVDAVVSYYADNAVAYPPNEPLAVGTAAIRKVWASYLTTPTFQISWKTTASGAEKAWGWTTGTYEDSFTGPDGKPVVEKGKYLCLWHKGPDGKWKAVRDMWNSDSK